MFIMRLGMLFTLTRFDMDHSEKTLAQRCVENCERGSQLRAIVEAVFHVSPRQLPAFADTCAITSDGYVICAFKDKFGRLHHGALVCDTDDLTRNFRGLADHMKLDDKERQALFAELHKWIAVDCRAAGKAPLK
jgi:hypothetical protein